MTQRSLADVYCDQVKLTDRPIPSIGRYIAYIKTIPGFAILIVLPTFVYIAFELKTIKQEVEKEVEKKFINHLGTLDNV